MSKGCKFSHDLDFAESTGFLIHPSGIIATAGHCVFDPFIIPCDPKIPYDTEKTAYTLKEGFLKWNFVFNLTQNQVSSGIPGENVFRIERYVPP